VKQFFSNGKLLISGEYVVLDGAIALAVPTTYGQSLDVETIDEPKIIWTSLDETKQTWFEITFEIKDNTIQHLGNDDAISNRLLQILNAVKQLNPNYLKGAKGFKITTKLDFPKNWGLGTSSTLINNLATWAQVDPYILLENTFGGSGYDIACAKHDTAISYQIKEDSKEVIEINFEPNFKNNLYFIHLNKKQNSRDGISHYREHKGDLSNYINQINEITQQMCTCQTLEVFQNLMETHENIIAEITKQTPVKQALFNDFKGSIKSLGAWGGDFILAATNANPERYFKAKGYNTVIPYLDMVK